MHTSAQVTKSKSG